VAKRGYLRFFCLSEGEEKEGGKVKEIKLVKGNVEHQMERRYDRGGTRGGGAKPKEPN